MAHRRNHRRHRNVGGDETLRDSEAAQGQAQAEQAAEMAAAAAFQSIPPLSPDETDAAGLREAKLARARALIADPGYPPKDVLNSVASLLADHLQNRSED